MLLNISIREICRSVELLSSDSTKYFILHNFQGILNLRGWWCLNSRQSISESSRKKICFRKTKNMSLFCPTLSDITFHGKHWRMVLSVLFIPARFNGWIGIWMDSRKRMIKNSGLKKSIQHLWPIMKWQLYENKYLMSQNILS